MPLEPSRHANGRMWQPGQSGNPNGRPVGSRTAYSRGFLSDLAEVWAERGKETMIKTAQDNPAVFFATCARLLPNSSPMSDQGARGPNVHTSRTPRESPVRRVGGAVRAHRSHGAPRTLPEIAGLVSVQPCQYAHPRCRRGRSPIFI